MGLRQRCGANQDRRAGPALQTGLALRYFSASASRAASSTQPPPIAL